MTTTPQKNRAGCLAVTLRLLVALLVVVLLLAIAGAIYEQRAEAKVAERFPPPGQLVEVKGRTLHIHCMGEGAPTVILDAGQGGWSSDWAKIMPEIAQSTRVCAYDRAGYGWSEAAGDERSPRDLADDLTALLSTAQIEPPYLLVAFSHSALGARLFAAQHAEQMAGLVLVDPATEFDNEIFVEANMLEQQRSAVGIFQTLGWLARIGVIRLLDPASMAGSAPFIATNPAQPEIYYAFVAGPQWWETSVREFTSHLNDEHLAMVRDQGQISIIPLTVIASDLLESNGNEQMTGVQNARHEQLAALAAQSAQSEFVVAEGSSHDILADRADVVVDAIWARLP